MMAQTLFQGGTILVHDDYDHVIPVTADLLVSGNLILNIEKNIKPTDGTRIIPCKDKIICPGFIDTHHHLWQSLMKGQWSNDTILDFVCTALFQNANHEPGDIFWAQIGGALECLDAGTTTVVDHAHFNYSPDHSRAAIAATISTGLRSIFCICPSSRLKSWSPLDFEPELLPDWFMQTLSEHASNAPYGDGRVQLGFGLDEFALPKEQIVALFNEVKSLGIKIITSHYLRSVVQGNVSNVAMLDDYGLLDSSILLSHVTNPAPGDAKLVRDANAHISSAPSSAMGMAMGHPTGLFHPSEDFYPVASMGTDSHAVNSSSIPMEMRMMLQDARVNFSQPFVEEGKIPGKLNRSPEDVFNLGTVAGARAIGMSDKVGRLKPNMLADIIVFNTSSPSMYGIAQRDPVAAIVTHSVQSDIELVMVDGIIRKEGGKLRNVEMVPESDKWLEGEQRSLSWNEISAKLVEKCNTMNERVQQIDYVKLREEVMSRLGIDKSRVV